MEEGTEGKSKALTEVWAHLGDENQDSAKVLSLLICIMKRFDI